MYELPSQPYEQHDRPQFDEGRSHSNETGAFHMSEPDETLITPGPSVFEAADGPGEQPPEVYREVEPVAEGPGSSAEQAPLPNFRTLNGGEPHRVARTQINAKLLEMAQVELGMESVSRAPVEDNEVDWDVDAPGYNPTHLDLPRGATRFGWPDDIPEPDDPSLVEPKVSLETGRPEYKNPAGRTGMTGRGMNNHWYERRAADAIIERENPITGEREALLIRREDNGEWALPGGGVKDNEHPVAAAGREVVEEAGVRGVDLDFSAARIVYQGYVDDSRNTDDAWTATTAVHIKLTPEQAAAIQLNPASDATDARWVPVTPDLYQNTFGNHGQLLRLAFEADPTVPEAATENNLTNQ